MEQTTLKFEEWQMENVYEYVTMVNGDKVRKLKEMKKVGDAPIRQVAMEQHQADTLNEQAENLNKMYFKI